MKIVILAAGKGSRLGDRELPKPLTMLDNGISILGYQLQQLTRHFPIDDIFIVVGYHKELIMEAFPDACFVYNPRFAEENTAKSLLRAARKVDEDLLWLNGDVIFSPSIIERIKISTANVMLVNEGAVGDEEVKYRTDGAGKIVAVAKDTNAPQGEALGINFFTAASLDLLRENLELCSDRDYFEKGVEMAIAKGMEVHPFRVNGDECTEIDFPADLQRANALLKAW